MKVRSLLILTAIVSSILGSLVVYLVLTVPNDLQADALLKSAGKDISTGRNGEARASLMRLVQQYPRTDGAAAAMVLLVKLADGDRQKLEREVRVQATSQNTQIEALTMKVNHLTTSSSTPVAPATMPAIASPVGPEATIVAAPAPKPHRRKKASRRHHSRRRRR